LHELANLAASVWAHPLDGALLDMNLRGRSSSPAADEFLERELPFLLVTGYDANDREPPAFQTASRIKKPFDIEDLTDGMREVFVGRLKAH
jgi:hypothetical protein